MMLRTMHSAMAAKDKKSTYMKVTSWWRCVVDQKKAREATESTDSGNVFRNK